MACDVAVLEGVFGFKLVKRTVLSSLDFHKSKALRLRQALQRVVATNLYENLFSAPNISLLHDRELMRGKTFFTSSCSRCEYVPPLKDFTCAPMDN